MLDVLMWWSFLSTLFYSSFISGAFIMAFVGAKKIPERLWLKLITTDGARPDWIIFPWLWFLFPLFAQFTIP